MRRNKVLFNGTCLLVTAVFMLGVASCGTLIYPERRGQTGGRIDAGVAVLDGVGLLLFVIPGAIAFVVDFATGAIYLPSSSSLLDLDPSDLQNALALQTDHTSPTLDEVEALVANHIGQDIDLRSAETRVARMSSDRGLVWFSISEVLMNDRLAVVENESDPGAG